MSMITKVQRKEIFNAHVAGKPAAQHDIEIMSNGATKIFSLIARGVKHQEQLIEESRKPKKAKRKYTRRKKEVDENGNEIVKPKRKYTRKAKVDAEQERGITIKGDVTFEDSELTADKEDRNTEKLFTFSEKYGSSEKLVK